MAKGSVDVAHSFNNYNKFSVRKLSRAQRKKNCCPGPNGIPEKYKFYTKATLDTGIFFCRNTSIHGLRYIVDSESDDEIRGTINRKFSSQSTNSKYSKLFTKFVFTIACAILGAGCLFMMSLVYDRYKTNPTVTSIETNNFPIYKVPFPAVTLCNINKVYLPATSNFTDQLSQTGVEKTLIDDFFEKLSALVNPEFIEGIYLKIYIILESMGYDSEKLMEELAQPCNNMLKMCFWLGKKIPCYKIFRVIESTQGFCCAFNFHGAQEEFSFFGNGTHTAQNHSSLERDLLYVTGAGRSVGLSVLLDIEPEKYTSVAKSYYGIDILIHDPQEQPNIVTAVAQPGQDIEIPVTPSVTVSEPNIRDLPIEQRLCYFPDERALRNTKKYTFQTCMAECKVDTILELCSCIPFYYPETKLRSFAKYFRQCSLRDVNCLRNNRHIYSSLAIAEIPDAEGNQTGMDCNCYPTCSERYYDTNALIGQRLDAKLATPMFGDINLGNLTSVHIYFQDLTCVKYRRDMYMSWDTLFSQFGGIFGFCLGGSVLSIIEFVYAFTFKLWFYISSHKKQPTIKILGTNSSTTTSRNPLNLTYRFFNYSKQSPFSNGN